MARCREKVKHAKKRDLFKIGPKRKTTGFEKQDQPFKMIRWYSTIAIIPSSSSSSLPPLYFLGGAIPNCSTFSYPDLPVRSYGR
jgi:hypothetical protein